MRQAGFIKLFSIFALIGCVRSVGLAQPQEERNVRQSVEAPFDAEGLQSLLAAEPQGLVDAAFRAADCETNVIERSAALLDIAKLCADAGMTNTALSALSRCLDTPPMLEADDQPFGRFCRSSEIYLQLGRVDDAMASLKEAELWVPGTNAVETADLRARLVMSYAKAGDAERACRYKEMVLGDVDRIEQSDELDEQELFLLVSSLARMSITILQQQGDADISAVLNSMLQLSEKIPDSDLSLEFSCSADDFWELGFLDPACTLVEHLNDDFSLLMELEDMVENSTTDEQISRVVELACSMDDDDQNRVLKTAAQYYVDRKQLDQAVSMLWQMRTWAYGYIRDETSSLVAIGYADAGDFRNAINLSKLITDLSRRAQTQAYIYSVLEAHGRGDEAENVMDLAMKSAELGALENILCEMADVLAEQGNRNKAFELLDQTYELIQKKSGSAYSQSLRFVDMAEVYLKLEDRDTAEKLLAQAQASAGNITKPRYETSAQKQIAKALAKAGHVREAAALILPLDLDESDQCFYLRRIAENCSSADDFVLLVELGSAIGDDDDHDGLMNDLVERGIEIGRMDLAAQAARTCRSEYSRKNLFEDISSAHAEKHDFQNAIDIALEIESDYSRFNQLAEIAKGCYQQNQLGLCAEAASLITTPREQAQVLAELACVNQD